MTKRVLFAGFMHETNTFSIQPTDMAAYHAHAFYVGDDVFSQTRGTKTEPGAFADAEKEFGWQTVAAVFANATPGGPVTQDVHDEVCRLILDAIQTQGPFDGVCLALHGAMVTEQEEDGEGALLAQVRGAVGSSVPIAVTLDLHANVTDRMAALADIMISYRTYPHVDQVDITMKTMGLLDRAMRGEIRPKVHVRRGQMLDGADHGRTTSPGPMSEALKTCDALMAKVPGTLAVSINGGFPWADIKETGPTCVVVGNGNDPAHGKIADTVIAELWQSRTRTTLNNVTVAEAMARIKELGQQRAPIVIADFADNPGGGGYGDSTRLLKGMIDARLENAAFGTLYDPAAALVCRKAGIGAWITLDIGGHVDPSISGPPLRVNGQVQAITDGTLNLEGPMMKGTRIEMSTTAVLKVDGIDIILTSRRLQNFDQMYFKHCGIEPRDRAYLAVKSAHHFRAAYQPIAAEIIVVDEGGGITSRNYKDLKYTNVRRPVYPLDLD